MLLLSLLLDKLGEYADHGLLKNVGEDHLLIVVAEVHQVLMNSFVLLGNHCHELLHLEDLDHSVAVDVPPLQAYADVHQEEEGVNLILDDLTGLWISLLEVFEKLVGNEVHALAVLGLRVEICVSLEYIEEGVNTPVAILIILSPVIEGVLTVCSFYIDQVAVRAVVGVFGV